jgi:hypothetical protein
MKKIVNMKNKIIIIIILSVTILLGVGSLLPVYAALKANLVAKPAVEQNDSYDSDLFTGSASSDYAIKVPEGTNGLKPEVNISYNSSGSRSFYQRVGLGWGLSESSIEKDVHYTPDNTGDDTYKLIWRGTEYKLVDQGGGKYKTKIESFLDISHLSSGANNARGDYWVVKTPDGTSYRLGHTSDSELSCSNRNFTLDAQLDSITDTHNNHIYYTYFKDNGLSYLQSIKYNNNQEREILFSYDGIAHDRSLYSQGCLQNEKYRLNNIKAKANGGLVHEYDMGYTNSAVNESLLTSILEKGSDGTSSLPATTYEYKPQVKSFSDQPVKWLDHVNLDYLHLNRDDVTVADVNGDGLLDIVRTSQVGAHSNWNVVLNSGSTWSPNYILWGNYLDEANGINSNEMKLIDVNGDGLIDVVRGQEGSDGSRSTWRVWKNIGTGFSPSFEFWVNNLWVSSARLNDPKTNLIDVNGDGLPDIVQSHTDTVNPPEWDVYKNYGDHWATNNTQDRQGWIAPKNLDLSNPNVRLIDVNGDNLPDIVQTSYSGDDNTSTDTWYVYKNTGSSWSTTPEVWVNNAPISAHLSRQSKLNSINSQLA